MNLQMVGTGKDSNGTRKDSNILDKKARKDSNILDEKARKDSNVFDEKAEGLKKTIEKDDVEKLLKLLGKISRGTEMFGRYLDIMFVNRQESKQKGNERQNGKLPTNLVNVGKKSLTSKGC